MLHELHVDALEPPLLLPGSELELPLALEKQPGLEKALALELERQQELVPVPVLVLAEAEAGAGAAEPQASRIGTKGA